MPNLYERDDNVPPVHIKHYPPKGRQPHLPAEGKNAPRMSPSEESAALVEVSYQELIITAAIDAAQDEQSSAS